jgi:acyl-CoA synthetase (AMP-forming)/AMP-acid ligase II
VLPPRFEAGLVLRAIAEHRCNWVALVPTMVRACLDHPDFGAADLSSLRVIVSGGAPVAPETARLIEERFQVRYAAIYGQTECGGVICQSMPDDSFLRRATTVGAPLDLHELRITGPDGRPAPVGEEGEVWIRGAGVFLGYVGDAAATTATRTADGWNRTGDVGALDEGGRLRIRGRLKDMIIRGGENLYPREIEDLLCEHPGVAACAVFGIADDYWGEVAVAAVVPAHDAAFDEHVLRTFLAARLSSIKVPTHFWRVAELPLNVSGKVVKEDLRREWTTAGCAS